MRESAQFEVINLFEAAGRKVLEGKILNGRIKGGMDAMIWLDDGAYWSVPVRSVEFVDHITKKEGNIGLTIDLDDEEDWDSMKELCRPGDRIKLLGEKLNEK